LHQIGLSQFKLHQRPAAGNRARHFFAG
jgi:hypothetical protein